MFSLLQGRLYKVQWKASRLGRLVVGRADLLGIWGNLLKHLGQVSETVFIQLPIYLHIYLFKYKSTIQWSY